MGKYCQYRGPVHTYLDKFENAKIFIRFQRIPRLHVIERAQMVKIRGLRGLGNEKMTSALPKSSGFTIHRRTIKQRFQISPLWRAFSNLSVFSGRKRRIRVNETRIRRNMVVLCKVVFEKSEIVFKLLASHCMCPRCCFKEIIPS